MSANSGVKSLVDGRKVEIVSSRLQSWLLWSRSWFEGWDMVGDKLPNPGCRSWPRIKSGSNLDGVCKHDECPVKKTRIAFYKFSVLLGYFYTTKRFYLVVRIELHKCSRFLNFHDFTSFQFKLTLQKGCKKLQISKL